ncbi:MAG: hypothetical protein Hyperionvirus2_205 [Hyperionvirus sp.]|uniref:Uncharacterized protein n=1 Tax=Hyperionvirus sp. TaxID=2487770 RepID=A0A3G5A6G4_9VIRU|nr:MAG: hypothetical protein Hyperionvirus2_205 [Hyperionvirus sp.]
MIARVIVYSRFYESFNKSGISIFYKRGFDKS